MPALTPAQSAGEQFGGAGGGGIGGSALAAAALPTNIAPANATAPTAPTTARRPGPRDGNIIAASPSSNEWRIHRAYWSSWLDLGRPILAVQARETDAMNADVGIAVGRVATIHGVAAVNANPGIA